MKKSSIVLHMSVVVIVWVFVSCAPLPQAAPQSVGAEVIVPSETPAPPAATETFAPLPTQAACNVTQLINVPLLSTTCIQVARNTDIKLQTQGATGIACTFTGQQNQTITISSGQTTSAPFKLAGSGDYTLKCGSFPPSVKIIQR